MLFARNGVVPQVSPHAHVAPTASIAGDVVIGAGAYVDHHVMIASAGPRIEIEENALVLAGSVVRSVGGPNRPAFGVTIGRGTLVAPHCVLTGCMIGRNCYLATGVIVLQGARVGDDARVGLGAVVHAGAQLPAGVHIGLRHIAVPAAGGYTSSADVDAVRGALKTSEFFDLAFGESHPDQTEMHRAAIARVRKEVCSWSDEAVDGSGSLD